jgi:CRP-like cAMP-binding protein
MVASMALTRAGRLADPKVALLRSVPGLGGIRGRDLASLASLFDEVRFDAGELVVREGEPGRELFILVEGKAAVSVGDHALALLGPGEFVGEMTLLERAPRSATVRALTPVRALVAGTSAFGALLAHPDVIRGMAAALARRLRASQGSPWCWPGDRSRDAVAPG